MNVFYDRNAGKSKSLKRIKAMPDTITVISLVWMTMVGAMLTAMVHLYDEKAIAAPHMASQTVKTNSYSVQQY